MNNYPTCWNDITVDTFIQIDAITKLNPKNEDEYNLHLVSLLCDMPIDEVEIMDYKEFNSLVQQFMFIRQLPIKPPKKTVETKGGTMHLFLDLKKMTNGEINDIEYLLPDYAQNIKLILAIVYRQKLENINPILFEDEFEKYGNWIKLRSNLFGNLCINDVYTIIPSIIKQREEIYQSYEGLLAGPPEDDDEDLSTYSEVDRAILIKAKDEEQKIRKWGWHLFIYQLANNDPLQIQKAYELNFVFSLNIMSMKRQMNIK